MAIVVDPDWWKSLFDEIYLVTDARSVCDEKITSREVDVICKLVPLDFNHKILDLCGGHGRHTFELYKRGYTNCTLLDYSQKLIDVARAEANRNDFAVNFLQCDARRTHLPGDSFDRVIVMGNSLGYTQASGADSKILNEAYRILRTGGWLLVDVADGKAVQNSFCPNAWHEVGADIVICRQRELKHDVIQAREMVIDKRDGLVRDRTYAIRLYDSKSLELLFQQAGFSDIRVHTKFAPHASAGDYGFMNDRMIAVGCKP
jgi:D-alanine-D-alanine ligase